MLIWYGPFARLADWFHGFRDGEAGIPNRPPPVSRPAPGVDDGRPAALRAVPRWRIATTPHREYLIRMAQDAFERERTRYEVARAAAARRLQAAREQQAAAAAVLAEAEREAEVAARPLTEEEETRRGLGEARHPLWFIRLRRRRDQQRRVAAAKRRLAQAQEVKSAADTAVAAAAQEERSHHAAAAARVRRIHEHYERRIAAYRRTLVRFHPDGAWVNHVIGVLDPTIPAWVNTGILPEEQPPTQPGQVADETDESVLEQPDPVPLGELTTVGSDEPKEGHIHVDYYRAAPKHFELRRVGDRFRLKEYGYGDGPFINGRQVGEVELGDGGEFDFGGHTYRIEIRADGSAWLYRRPLGESHLIVHRMSAKTGDTTRLLDMSVVQRAGTVMAILGPSGAGKTSLFFALMNELKPAEGSQFYFRGRNVGENAEQIRTMLGFVPQHDHLYRTLTVRQLLTYADRVHNPGGRRDRKKRIEKVCKKLRVDDRIDRLVGTLSGGQLKRVSIALELLREPELLMLDEPTSGLDAGMDREVMKLLEGYAVGGGPDGRIVIVITHTTTHLAHAHQLLVLATMGRPIFAGEGRDLFPTIRRHSGRNVRTYADLMDLLTSPDKEDEQIVTTLAQAYQTESPMVALAEAEARRAAARAVAVEHRAIRAWRVARRFWHQLPILIQRQVHLLMTRGSAKNARSVLDRLWSLLRALLPFLIALGGTALVALVAKPEGLGPGHSTVGALGLLTTVCLFTSQTVTSTDIVYEFEIIRRERRTGTIAGAVLLAKWLVFAVLAVIQAAIITVVFLALRPGPPNSHVFAPNTELFVNLAALCVAAMTLGLLVSTLAKKVEQAVLVNALVMIGEIALNGASTDLTESVLAPLAMLLPSRWGLAAAASSMDLRSISTAAVPDAMWQHTTGQWINNLGALLVLTVVFFATTVVFLRRRLRNPD